MDYMAVIGIGALFGIFILFLVLSKTLNNSINHLVKLHYLLQKEVDLKKERLVIARLLEEEKNITEGEGEAATPQGNRNGASETPNTIKQ